MFKIKFSKIEITLIFFLLLACVIIATLVYKYEKDTYIDFDKFEMSVKSFDNNTMVLIVENGTNGEWFGGDFYGVQRLIGGVWENLDEGSAFTSIGYHLLKNESKEFTINLEQRYGHLPPGEYRIFKDFDLYNETETYGQSSYFKKEKDVRLLKYCYFQIKVN